MAELAKKLHFLKSGTEQTSKAYSTVTEAGTDYITNKIDGVTCYVPIGETSDSRATNGRITKSGTTKAILSSGKPVYTEKSYTTAGTYTFTVPAGVTRMRVAVCGGGGGGAYNYTYKFDKTSQGGTGGTSSFGSLLKAIGGGGAIDKWWKSGTDSEGHPDYSNNKTAGSAGSPNGNAGSIVKGRVDVNGGTGFSLSFSKSSGSYGTGGGVYTKGLSYTNETAPTGGSGGYNSSYVTVTTGSTYTITVGAGGSGGSYGNSSKAYGKAGKSGFVFIAYGGDI